MSITSDFWKAMNQSGTKVSGTSQKSSSSGGSIKNTSGGSVIESSSGKKKKKKSITDEFWEAMGDDDIAPVSSVADRVQARTDGGLTTLPFHPGEDDGELVARPFRPGVDSVSLERLPLRTGLDLAPIASPTVSKKDKGEEDKERTWFDKGAFRDGYQIGDVSKVILGTIADVGENLGAGIMGMGEKAVDALVYLAPAANAANQALNGLAYQFDIDEYRKQQKYSEEFIKKDLYNEEEVARKIISSTVEKIPGVSAQDSVLGEKSDSLMQSGGQFLGTMGLQAVGVPWWLTYGTTSFGEESENALNQGASYEEAGASAAVSAAAEVLTEKLSGGIKFGGNTLDDALTKQIARSISNKYIRTGMKLGLDAFGEGSEEWITSDIQKFGQWLTYQDEKELKELLFSEEAMDEKIEAFIGGAALGGGISTINAVKSASKGIDYATEMTANEKSVVDKVYQDRVAEAEKNGKVTEKQKSKIYDQVLNDFEKGYISTETIEEVLGDKDYQAYKETVDSEDALFKEFEELGKKQNATLAEQARYSELQRQVADIKKNSTREALKNRLSESVYQKAQGDRLVESYNERARRGQAFEADLSKYDAKQRQTIQNAINSGTLNNTNRTHELVDFIAKISADKGVLFDFTNNEKIKGTQFAVDGKIVNGYVTDSGITLNVESPKYLESTVGHEITHVLEGSEFYDTLKQTIFDYAKTKGEYDTRLKNLTELYKNVKDADVEAELTADLVGDYIFADKDFVNKLSTENRNVFQKIYDEIKYLCKVATAGSKEARELEKVKKVFEDAYRANGKHTGTKHSLSDPDSLFDSITDEELDEILKDVGYELEDNSYSVEEEVTESKPRYKGDTTTKGKVAKLTEERIEHLFRQYGASNPIYAQAYIATIHPRDFLSLTLSDESFQKWDKAAADGTNEELYPLDIEKLKSNTQTPFLDIDTETGEVTGHEGRHRMRALLEAGVTEVPIAVYDSSTKYSKQKESSMRLTSQWFRGKAINDNFAAVVKNLIPLNAVNRSEIMAAYGGKGDVKFSLSDSDGKQLTKEQQDYFKDSKMRDENGNLKVMYHGSQDAGFHVFDSQMSDDGTSFFFVDRNDVAASYSGTAETYEAKTIRTSEDMNNFLAEIGYDHYEAVEKDGKFELLENGDHVAWSDTAQGIYEEFCWYEGVGDGDANYKVYLNLKNPLEVDAQGRNWNNVSREYSQEVADRYNSLTAEEKAALYDIAGWGEISIFRDEIRRATDGALASAYKKMGDVNMYDLFTIAEDNFAEDTIKQFAVKQMTTRDYAKKAKAEGYDGVIFKNIHDNGVYSNGSEGASTVAIAFDSNQIKSVANEKPTADKDIRFSLSESVEETKDLVALHNLTGEKLLKSLNLGGLPMPSVAIAKAKDGHNEFGEISLVLPRETIDPKASRNNKLYSGDAWTPTYPKVDFKPSEKVLRNARKKISGLVPYEVQDALGSIALDEDNARDSLDRYNGNMVEAYKNDDAMKYAYLKDTGSDISLPMKEEDLYHYGGHSNAAVRYFSGKLVNGLQTVNLYRNMGASEVLQDKALMEAIADAQNFDVLRTMEPGSAEYLEYERNPVFRADDVSFRDVDNFLSAARKLFTKGVQQTVDRKAAKELIRGAVDQTAYERWLVELFSGIVEKEGIRNNKDYFTPSGNRRSFEALHYEHNLENVIKAMREKGEKGIGFGGGSIFGAATTEFSSVEEMKKSGDRLQQMSEEEYQEIKDGFTNRFFALASSLPNDKKSFMATDDAANTLTEAVSKYKTRSGIANYLRRELKGWATYSDQVVDDLIELVNDIRNMPTGYFEAKPQRAVGFDEVAVFIIPYDADVKLKQELLNRGYAIAEYDPKVEGDRTRVLNQFEEYKFSLSNVGDTPYGRGTLGKDVALEVAPVAPIADNAVSNTENVLPNAERVKPDEMAEMFPDEPTPQTELDNLLQEKEALESRMSEMGNSGDLTDFESVNDRYVEVATRIAELESEISESESGRVNSLDDSDVPPEMDAPYYESEGGTVSDPFYERDISDVGNRKIKAYMYENPEVKPFFQEAANVMLGDLTSGTKGEKIFNDEVYYESGGEKGWMGTKRTTTADIAELLDQWHYTYAEIEKGLKAIIEDNGKENNAVSKRIEFMLNDRLMNGYTGVWGEQNPPNQAYIDLLYEKQINEYSKEAFDAFMANADQYAPEDIAPVAKNATTTLAAATPDTMDAPIYQSKDPNAVRGQTTMFEPPKPNPSVATVLTKETQKAQEKSGIGKKLVSQLVDKGMVFENLSLETGNNEIQAKWDYALPSHTEARAQHFMENGANGVKPLKDIKKAVDKSGKADDFFNYLYHVHNIDRMTLDDRFGVENKTVFGETVTAEVSRRKAAQYEKANHEFKEWANDVYAYNRHLRQMLVDGNIISQETANLWEKMYPHYVPIRRVDAKGQNISVPLDTNKTGVNNPVKRAIGGSSDIQPVFATMAQRTEQTYRAIARNQFGIELKNTLGSTINSQENVTGVDEAVDTLVAQEDHLLKPGAFNSNPTFTVFENGERVEFEITEDMYEALKPAGKILGHRIEAVNKIGNFRRNLLTVWNPVFALYRNPIKDIQDVAVNSQHPVRTYLNVPNAIWQMATDGKWATEYHQNGGKSNTYFDSKTNTFKEDNIFKKTIGMPVRAVEAAGEFIEEIPRLAEYIASRQDGRSIERSMLDAGRVTTNFAAGGDFTKFLNSHGFTFLNASVQGASQHVRNFREAKANGLKGYVKVLAKYTVAGLPGILLNSLLWDDDEDYEELSDYVKQNYYVVAKTEDGKFVRIPKGRTAAVMQNAMEQMQNLVTGNDEVDFGTFFELFMNNIAPNNPIENNILAPIGQVWKNEAWYGGDLVPSRLQDLPAAEQFDESTDSISKWLGEKTNTSPYKWNYLLDQYSGGMGDVFLPMLTPEAESGDNSTLGNFLAPWKKEITTDKVLNNKNPGNFYDLRDELEVKSNSRNATEEDAMRTMYMDSVSWDMSDLYKQKREVQNSDLPDDEKYEEVRKIQEQINELAKNAMSGYNNVHIDGLYSEVGDRRYNKDAESGKWYEIQAKNSDGSDNWYYQKEQEVTKALGISYGEYWNNREEYNYAYDNPEKYTFSKAVGGYDSFRSYTSELWDIKADKDENGKSINGSRKAKVIDYINDLDADYGEKIILFKSEYNADDTYNMDIIEYLNGREDIDYQEMESILKYLGFEVDSQGNISW